MEEQWDLFIYSSISLNRKKGRKRKNWWIGIQDEIQAWQICN